MADAPRDPDLDHPGDADPGTPRWVIVFGVVGVVLLLAFLVLHLAGLGPRGH